MTQTAIYKFELPADTTPISQTAAIMRSQGNAAEAGFTKMTADATAAATAATAASASAAAASATAANTSKTAAATSATAAATSATGAATSKTGADTAKTAAEAANTASQTAKTAAQTAAGQAQAVVAPVVLSGTTDLNDYTATGRWAQNANASAIAGANYPVPLAGLLEVFTNGTNMIYQHYTEYNTGIIHTRTKYTTTWFPWSEVAQESAWTKLANASGWSDYVGGGGYRGGLWARRFGDNVQIAGMVKSGSGVMATLPANLMPSNSAMYPAIAAAASAGVVVQNTGDISYLFGPAAPSYVNITLTIPLH